MYATYVDVVRAVSLFGEYNYLVFIAFRVK